MAETETKKKTDPKDRVAVLRTSGQPLVIGSGPTAADVKRFVKEHNRRFFASEPGGPGGHPAVQVFAAYWFDTDSPGDEYDWESAPKIALGDALKPASPTA
jgi:hypothetical protein